MYYNFAAGSFLSKKLCSRLHSTEVDFYSKKGKFRSLSHPSGDLECKAVTGLATFSARIVIYFMLIRRAGT